MYELLYTSQFKKDYKKVSKGKRIEKLHQVFKQLSNTGTLPAKYKTHVLKGNYKGYHEAHIEPDWLLIWKKSNMQIKLIRTGSHSELFK